MDECLVLAEDLRTQGSVMECVKYYLLSSSPELGLAIGLKHVKSTLCYCCCFFWLADLGFFI